MENNEEKKGCCENKEGMNCGHGMGCCGHFKKCHMMKKLMIIILLVIAFCLGSQWGEMKGEYRSERGFERGGMMNWGYGKFENVKGVDAGQTTGSVTVEVAKPATPTTPAPKQ